MQIETANPNLILRKDDLILVLYPKDDEYDELSIENLPTRGSWKQILKTWDAQKRSVLENNYEWYVAKVQIGNDFETNITVQYNDRSRETFEPFSYEVLIVKEEFADKVAKWVVGIPFNDGLDIADPVASLGREPLTPDVESIEDWRKELFKPYNKIDPNIISKDEYDWNDYLGYWVKSPAGTGAIIGMALFQKQKTVWLIDEDENFRGLQTPLKDVSVLEEKLESLVKRSRINKRLKYKEFIGYRKEMKKFKGDLGPEVKKDSGPSRKPSGEKPSRYTVKR